MKIAILYFSGTGVTAKFARDIAEGFQQEQHQIDFYRLKVNREYDFSGYDIIGIGSPAYSFRIPRLVSKLLRKIDFHNKPFFVFATSGGMPGNALWNLFRHAKKTGGECIGDLSGIATTNLRSWMPKKDEKSLGLIGLYRKDIVFANTYAKTILANYQKLNSNPTRKQIKEMKPIPGFLVILWSLLFTYRWMMAATVGKKRITKEKCTQCNLCVEKICPSDAISIRKKDYPTFNEWKCIGCNGCVNLCPEEAIWSFSTRNHIQYDLYKEYILDDEN